MPRWCQRVRLESGLKLDINHLARQGAIRSDRVTGPVGITWTNSYTGEGIASGSIRANISDSYRGWLQIRIGSLDQQITLVALPRHFGGRQCFFLCPDTARRAMVLWLAPRARYFCCRERRGRRGRVKAGSLFLAVFDGH